MNIFQRVVLSVFGVFYPQKVLGKENIPEGAAVVVCNHYMNIDCGFLKKIFRDKSYFLAKEELFKNGFIRWFIKSYGAIPINRDNPAITSIIAATKVLKDGGKLIVFPEGTRNKTKERMLPLKEGSALFAIKAKCPIIPVMIWKKAKIFRKTYLIIGKPICLDEYYGKKVEKETLKQLDELIRERMLCEQDRVAEVLRAEKEKKRKRR